VNAAAQAAIAAMRAKGIPAGDILDVVEAMLSAAAEPVAIVDAQAERRRAADRLRKAEKASALRNSAESAEDKRGFDSPLSPNPYPPLIPQKADDDVGAQARANVTLAEQCLAAAGLSNDPKAVFWSIQPIASCRDGGASVELDILPTIRRISASGRNPKSWSYFAQPIMDAKAAREAPAPIGRATGPPRSAPKHDARADLHAWIAAQEAADEQDRERQADRPPLRLLASSGH
jgi:hypothetical protein